MRKNILLILIGSLILFGIIILISSREWARPLSETSSSSPILVSTSFYPLYYFTSQIGGDKINIRNITPAGAEPHDYEPTIQDLVFIEKSKLFILNGGNLEPWVNNIKAELEEHGTKILEVGEGLFTHQIKESEKTIIDPHIWLSPVLAKEQVKRIADAIIDIDPIHKDYYEENTKKLIEQLTQLDSKYREGLKNCKNKEIITSHIAFSYLAQEYGFTQVAINGLSPDEEPSAKQLTTIAQFAKDHDIKYIFFESLINSKLSQTIAEEVGANTLVLNPLEGLKDEEIRQGKNYFTEMELNLTNLRIALACQ